MTEPDQRGFDSAESAPGPSDRIAGIQTEDDDLVIYDGDRPSSAWLRSGEIVEVEQ